MSREVGLHEGIRSRLAGPFVLSPDANYPAAGHQIVQIQAGTDWSVAVGLLGELFRAAPHTMETAAIFVGGDTVLAADRVRNRIFQVMIQYDPSITVSDQLADVLIAAYRDFIESWAWHGPLADPVPSAIRRAAREVAYRLKVPAHAIDVEVRSLSSAESF